MAIDHPVAGFKFDRASLNCDGWRGPALLAAVALLTLSEAFGDAGRMALRFDRGAISSGEWWRLLTAHFVHLGPRHAALNALGLVLMWLLFAREFTARHWLWIMGLSIAAVDAGLWFLEGQLSWYVGASGTLHGVMAAGALARARRRDFEGWLLAAFLAAKLAYEQAAGPTLVAGTLGAVVVNAHLYGAIGGLIGALLRFERRPL